MTKRIVQIMPATGWSAVYAMDEDGKWLADSFPLCCWALVKDEHDEELRVEGMDAGGGFVDFSEDSHNFLDYAGPTADIRSWDGEAEEYGKREDRKMAEVSK